MSKYDKLSVKLLSRFPAKTCQETITYQEIAYLLGKMGYEETKKGKTSGSRVAFIHRDEKHLIRLHKPHPGNELKDYVKKEIIAELKDKNLI